MSNIIVVDDCCPEESGKLIERSCTDPRVEVIYHAQNLGVGGALVTGYQAALKTDAEVFVKLDGDGQMDPTLIPQIVAPIEREIADYTKGNRFFSLETLELMPKLRLLGNSILSFVTKIVTGHWHVMDPNNGYTAIHRTALELLPLNKIDKSYFFETDMLFRLYTIEAVVTDIPMSALYQDEESNMSLIGVALRFPAKYLSRFLKRIAYMYYIRDFNAASIQFVIAIVLLSWAFVFGTYSWTTASMANEFASSGTVMLAGAPLILGVQFLLAAISYDVSRVPRISLQQRLSKETGGNKDSKPLTVIAGS